MELLILGVGDAFTARSFGSSGLLRADDGMLALIDCPDLIHRAIREASEAAGWNIDVLRILDVIITHLHGDHSNGLESFGFYHRIARANGLCDTIPRLHAATPVLDRVWEKLAPAMDGPFMDAPSSSIDDYFDLRPLDPAHPAAIGALSVECRFTNHPIPTTGLLVREGDRCIGWSADTPFEREHIDWLAAADLIVHETNVGTAHTPIERLNELPESIRSKMRLIHMPDDFDPACTTIETLRAGQRLVI